MLRVHTRNSALVINIDKIDRVQKSSMYCYVCIQVLSASEDATVQFQGETEDNGMYPLLVSLGALHLIFTFSLYI